MQRNPKMSHWCKNSILEKFQTSQGIYICKLESVKTISSQIIVTTAVKLFSNVQDGDVHLFISSIDLTENYSHTYQHLPETSHIYWLFCSQQSNEYEIIIKKLR